MNELEDDLQLEGAVVRFINSCAGGIMRSVVFKLSFAKLMSSKEISQGSS